MFQNFLMKKLYPTIILILFVLTANAQAPNWAWAKSEGGTGTEYGLCAATDGAGNLYVTGTFSSPTITFGSTTLTNAGSIDFYIVKYDPMGNILWAKGAGGNGVDFPNPVKTDAFGNVYVSGYFDSDSITIGTTTLINVGNYDLFIVKYSSSGNVLWARTAGSTQSDQVLSAATDANGNLYITGSYDASITIGAISLNNSGGSDIYVAKYDPSGNVLWANRAGGWGGDVGIGISTDDSMNVYVTGFYSSSILFGSTTLSNAGSADVFMVKYNASGSVIWAKGAGGTGFDYGNYISTDVNSNVYVTGSFESNSISFGSNTFNNAGSRDIFIAKYNTGANLIWAKAAGGTELDYAGSAIADASGNLFVTGSYQSTSITFGSTTLSNADITGNSADMCIAKYDALGNVLWAKSEGGTGTDNVWATTSDSFGNLYFIGHFNSPSITLGSTTLTNAGSFDMIIAKLGNNSIGIGEQKEPIEIKIYPNPSNGVFNFNETKHIRQVEVYNLLGEEILAQGNQKQINLSCFANGIYYARINGEVVVKLVKE
jgi:hypothetical protein